MWHLPWDRKPKDLWRRAALPPAESHQEQLVDEAIDESFPASDPPAHRRANGEESRSSGLRE